MKYLSLLVAGLWRKPIHTVLTTLAIAVAFVLFGIMHGVIAGFDNALDQMSDTRLRVMSRANYTELLPIAHGPRIAQVPGVKRVAHATILAAYFQEPQNGLSAAAVDMDSFLAAFPEIEVPPDRLDALRRTRTGATVGSGLAGKYGWEIGDRIPLQSHLWVNEEGGRVWEFEVVAIHNGDPEDQEIFASELYFHYAYLEEARATDKGAVHQFILSIDDPENAVSIAHSVDALFANSFDETTTVNEKQWVTSRMSQLGDVRLFVYSILLAVLFTLLLLTGTAMTQSIHERIPEFGVLKAVGFSDVAVFTIVLCESLARCLAGGLLGLGIAAVVFPSVFRSFGIPSLPLEPSVYALGVGIAAVLGIAVSVWPGLRVRRLSIVDAIGGH